MPLTPEQRQRARGHFQTFLGRRVTNLERLTLDHLKFNILLLRVTATLLELSDPRALLRYRLAQHLERGLVTAFGSTLQAIAKDIAGHATGVAGADIMLVRDGRRYYIQVKSGPDTANQDIAQNISALLNSARARDPEAVCYLGVCYGRSDQISQIALTQLQLRGVGLLVGREFWDFISGDETCLDELVQLAAEVALSSDRGEETFAQRVERKLEELTRVFISRYGERLDDSAWARFLADNS